MYVKIIMKDQLFVKVPLIVFFPTNLTVVVLLSDTHHSKGVDCTDGDIRLAHGPSEHEGRLEVCVNRLWGTVCSSPSSIQWTSIDSSVVCGQLGHMRRGMYYGAMFLQLIMFLKMLYKNFKINND